MTELATKVYRRKTDPTVYRPLNLLIQEAGISDRKLSQVAYELWSLGEVHVIKTGRRVLVADPATTSTRTLDGEECLVIKPVGATKEIVVESDRHLRLALPDELQGRLPDVRDGRLVGAKPFLRAWDEAHKRIRDFMR